MTIEKGIPIPPKVSLKATMMKMEVGDSILVEAKKKNSISTTAYDIGIKIERRKQPDGQIRVWRKS